jgi:hypothetical protein
MYTLLDALFLTSKTRDTGVRISRGSSSGNGFGTRGGKGGRKGPPIVREGSIGPESYSEAVYEFPVESKGEFTRRSLLEDTMTARKIGQNVCMVRTA